MAARNLGQLRQALQDLSYGTDQASAQNGFINSEYRKLAGRRRWDWLEATNSSQVTLAGTSVYIPPMTDMRNLDAVRIVDASFNAYFIEPFETQRLLDLERRDQGTTGVPAAWAQYASTIHFWPTPDQVYTITYYYVKNVTALVLDADVPLVPEEYDEILVWGATSRMAFRQRDWLGRDFANQQRLELLATMEGEYTMQQRQSSERVRDDLWRP